MPIKCLTPQLESIINIMQQSPDKWWTSGELAKEVGVFNSTARHRLTDLWEAGYCSRSAVYQSFRYQGKKPGQVYR